MTTRPHHFESFFTRLGLQVHEENTHHTSLVWHGMRFPGWLCLGLSVVLLFVSLPVVQAIHLQGLGSVAGSLWYFPAMNIVLFFVAAYLLSLGRRIVIDHEARRLFVSKKSLFHRRVLEVEFSDIRALRLGTDMVYSGPVLAGSTTGQSFFPASSLRLVLSNGETLLLDRGEKKRMKLLARQVEHLVDRPVTDDPLPTETFTTATFPSDMLDPKRGTRSDC